MALACGCTILSKPIAFGISRYKLRLQKPGDASGSNTLMHIFHSVTDDPFSSSRNDHNIKPNIFERLYLAIYV